MFMGEYHHTLDSKNRLIIPAVLRQQNNDRDEKFVLTRGLDKSLFLYALSGWQALGERLKNISTVRSDTRAFLRVLFSGAHQVCPDKQGRITLPQTLKDFAEIKEKVAIIGAFNKIEIWSEKEWSKYYQEKKAIFEQISEKIMDIEI